MSVITVFNCGIRWLMIFLLQSRLHRLKRNSNDMCNLNLINVCLVTDDALITCNVLYYYVLIAFVSCSIRILRMCECSYVGLNLGFWGFPVMLTAFIVCFIVFVNDLFVSQEIITHLMFICSVVKASCCPRQRMSLLHVMNRSEWLVLFKHTNTTITTMKNLLLNFFAHSHYEPFLLLKRESFLLFLASFHSLGFSVRLLKCGSLAAAITSQLSDNFTFNMLNVFTVQ